MASQHLFRNLGFTEEVEQLVEVHKEEEQLREKRIKLIFPHGSPY